MRYHRSRARRPAPPQAPRTGRRPPRVVERPNNVPHPCPSGPVASASPPERLRSRPALRARASGPHRLPSSRVPLKSRFSLPADTVPSDRMATSPESVSGAGIHGEKGVRCPSVSSIQAVPRRMRRPGRRGPRFSLPGRRSSRAASLPARRSAPRRSSSPPCPRTRRWQGATIGSPPRCMRQPA